MNALTGFFYIGTNSKDMNYRINIYHFLKLSFCCVFLICISFINAQSQNLDWFDDRNEFISQSPYSDLSFENIGPTVFSGRVADIDVNPSNPAEFYVAYASGGLWYTNNNGTTFTPLFDQEAVMTLGDVAVNWKNGHIWVGTGEVNSSRSSYAGVGMYKSEDKGKTWQHKGLNGTDHIGRIVLFPDEPNKLAVAALGKLYSTNEDRGIYLTNDDGESWLKTLYVDSITGGVDLIIDPTDENILYAAMWHRIRKAWNFTEAGKGSGLYKSVDGGSSWTRLNNDGSGFPNGEGVGRIGLDISADGKKVYALLDNYFRRPAAPKKKSQGLTKEEFVDMTAASFSQIPKSELEAFLKDNGFPKKYDVVKVKEMVASNKIKPSALKEYLEDANRLLFDTQVIGAEVYCTVNGGKSWAKTHNKYLNNVYNSYGYYFGQIRVAPRNKDQIYIMGVPILRSDDGGNTYVYVNGENVHVDHHALWINPNIEGHIINGNDGGINISYDHGESWIKCNSPSVGQFYYINVDNAEPYNVYGGLQDNGVWMGSHYYREGVRWHNTGRYPYQSIMGGDGMQIQIDKRDNTTVYTGFQFGNYFRINTQTSKRQYITPKHELGDRPYRWNWQSPIHLSVHNQDILYLGSNKLLRSFNQGDDFEEISGDLTNGGKPGDVPYGTLSSVHESRLKFGLIYTGSDDGAVHVTKDGGHSWTRIDGNLPQGLWVSRIQASAHKESRVYLSLNGYRNDSRSSYLYMSDDYGSNWTDLSGLIPHEAVNVFKEDAQNENMLFVGTDHSTYISIDMGKSFQRIGNNIPQTPVHDLVVQERDDHLLIGTHGRSIFKASLAPYRFHINNKDQELTLMSLSEIKHSSAWGNKRSFYSKINSPNVDIHVYSKVARDIDIKILTQDKKELKKLKHSAKAGLNLVKFDLTIDDSRKSNLEKHVKSSTKNKKASVLVKDDGNIYLEKGTYIVLVQTGSHKSEQSLVIE